MKKVGRAGRESEFFKTARAEKARECKTARDAMQAEFMKGKKRKEKEKGRGESPRHLGNAKHCT